MLSNKGKQQAGKVPQFCFCPHDRHFCVHAVHHGACVSFCICVRCVCKAHRCTVLTATVCIHQFYKYRFPKDLDL